ncbi:hypothetical protein TNCV_4571101 [Trichonephila clavipes]|nr:hypothetical protein TNCV_4571101 [Trichonephila clavipes]
MRLTKINKDQSDKDQVKRRLHRHSESCHAYSPLVSMERKKGIRTAADSVQSGWPVVASSKRSLRAQAQQIKTKTKTFELVKENQNFND